MDSYLVLGLEQRASEDDIRRAYRRLARKYHPDINPGDRIAATEFRRIVEAYETLVDPVRRRQYDDGSGVPVVSQEPRTFEFEGFDFSVSVSGASAPTFGDLFADMLQPGQRSRAGGPERGADLHLSLTLDFAAAMRGGRRRVTVTRAERCRSCQGRGRIETRENRCLPCQGTGVVKSARGHMVFSRPCARCNGRGVQAETGCPACGGRQVQIRAEPIVLDVPPGIVDGGQIRVAEMGHAGLSGGPNGDLYVTVSVEAHPLFRREGDDLHLTVPLAIHEAALGARIDVPTPDGVARLRVPPGTQSGQQFRMRERGAPSMRTGGRGDLIVEVRLVLPSLLDERSKDLLREFGRINAADVRADLLFEGRQHTPVDATPVIATREGTPE